ncbi:unnamed protein product, partial [Iphiclides podalirius]
MLLNIRAPWTPILTAYPVRNLISVLYELLIRVEKHKIRKRVKFKNKRNYANISQVYSDSVSRSPRSRRIVRAPFPLRVGRVAREPDGAGRRPDAGSGNLLRPNEFPAVSGPRQIRPPRPLSYTRGPS